MSTDCFIKLVRNYSDSSRRSVLTSRPTWPCQHSSFWPSAIVSISASLTVNGLSRHTSVNGLSQHASTVNGLSWHVSTVNSLAQLSLIVSRPIPQSFSPHLNALSRATEALAQRPSRAITLSLSLFNDHLTRAIPDIQQLSHSGHPRCSTTVSLGPFPTFNNCLTRPSPMLNDVSSDLQMHFPLVNFGVHGGDRCSTPVHQTVTSTGSHLPYRLFFRLSLPYW